MALCVVYLFLRLCMASRLSVSLYLYMNLFSPKGLPLFFSVTLDSVVPLVASKGGFLVQSGKNKLGKWDKETELWKTKLKEIVHPSCTYPHVLAKLSFWFR